MTDILSCLPAEVCTVDLAGMVSLEMHRMKGRFQLVRTLHFGRTKQANSVKSLHGARTVGMIATIITAGVCSLRAYKAQVSV